MISLEITLFVITLIGVIVLIYRLIYQRVFLDKRIQLGDQKLLDENDFEIEKVTQAPIGSQLFPSGTQIILKGEAAIEFQKQLSREEKIE